MYVCMESYKSPNLGPSMPRLDKEVIIIVLLTSDEYKYEFSQPVP